MGMPWTYEPDEDFYNDSAWTSCVLNERKSLMIERNEAIARIKKALKARSGKVWSVTGSRGTAWGWITIDAPPARRTWHYERKLSDFQFGGDYQEVNDPSREFGHMSPDDRKELAELLGVENVHHQGQSIPPDSREWFVLAAEGTGRSAIIDQYHAAKEKHPAMLLLFRVEGSYETFDEDAETSNKILGLKLATQGQTKMACFPHHQLKAYLRKLISKGLRVAICEPVAKAGAG